MPRPFVEAVTQLQVNTVISLWQGSIPVYAATVAMLGSPPADNAVSVNMHNLRRYATLVDARGIGVLRNAREQESQVGNSARMRSKQWDPCYKRHTRKSWCYEGWDGPVMELLVPPSPWSSIVLMLRIQNGLANVSSMWQCFVWSEKCKYGRERESYNHD